MPKAPKPATAAQPAKKSSSGCVKWALIVVAFIFGFPCLLGMVSSIFAPSRNSAPDDRPRRNPAAIRAEVGSALRNAFALAESGDLDGAKDFLEPVLEDSLTYDVPAVGNLHRSIRAVESKEEALRVLVDIELSNPEEVTRLRAGDCPASLKTGGPSIEEKTVLALQAVLPELPAAAEAERQAREIRRQEAAEKARLAEIARIEAEEQAKVDAAAAQRKARYEKHFSKWDGSHSGLVAYVKSKMHNPDSFQHVSTRYHDSGKNLVIQMKFRGTNKFNAIVSQSVVADVTYDGVVTTSVGF